MSFRRISTLTAGLFLSVSAGAMSAQAADVGAPAIDLWSGFYLGAQAGYAQGTYGDTDLCQSYTGEGNMCFGDYDDGFDLSDSNPAGVTVGGYLGYNYRVDSFVMGLEGDLNWDNGRDNNSVYGELNYTSALNWDASIRARLGMVVDERALLYVTGGPSWLGTELKTDFDYGSPAEASGGYNFNKGDSGTEFGWVLGAGAEYSLTDHLSVKAEYIHGWYGDADQNIFSASDGGSTEKIYLKQNLQTNVVRAGIAYHFGGL